MKILHVGKYYAPFRGGMETVLQNVAEGLLDAGHDVAVLVAGSAALDRCEELTGPRTARKGRLLRSGAAGLMNSQPLTASLYAHLRREVAALRPDVIHVHLPNPLAAAVWSLPGDWHGPAGPVLAVWHHADVTRQRLGGRLLRPLTRRFLSAAAGISVSSRTLAERSAELEGHRDRVAVVPFGIRPAPWIDLEPRGDGPFLFLGRLVPYKGISVLIDAVAQVPDADLVVVGEGPLENELRERVRADGLEHRISMVGRLEPEDVLRLMRRARGLVLPSIDTSETFGLVQLEAMASAVPVIASDLPTGVREVGIDGETGLLVPPGDAAALAEALRRLVDDPQRAREMGQAGRKRFKKLYTRAGMIERLTDWYESLLAR